MGSRSLGVIWAFVIIALIGISLTLYVAYSVKVTIIRVEGRLVFTDQYNPDATLCFPAAYTDVDGNIEGEYRIGGRSYGTATRKERMSLHPQKGILISGTWLSDNGFQQHVLVKESRARKFIDTRRAMRRALCNEGKDSSSLLIIESTYPMTLTEFAEEVSKYCYNAVNLDMGRYGYGWNGRCLHSKWAFWGRKNQTNWIIVE